jgi:hypothetical protein
MVFIDGGMTSYPAFPEGGRWGSHDLLCPLRMGLAIREARYYSL